MPSAIGNERDIARADVAPQGSKKKSFRPDIQGLRMVAVVAVVLDHLVHWPSGGFVGVDVFFVISGFLITSLLLREHDKTQSISFSGFYRRRVKRIVPAAMLVIVATVGASFLLFNLYRAQQTMFDGIWATFFTANWHFAAVGTDYFQADGPVSPLQHFWSLSVEEQFYFVWPWVMLLIFALYSRRSSPDRARRIILLAVIVITVASFAWALWESSANPTWAYFSTFSRAWELGVGAVIAVIAGVFTRIPRALRPVLGWIGLTGIVVSLFVVTDAAAFPAPWAVLPVLSTALVIIAGTGGEQRFFWPLMNPVSTYLGDISYSLYLWHFPVIILLGVVIPEGEMWFYVVAVLLMSALSVMSYHLVENPIRQSAWLEPSASRRGSRRRADRAQRWLVGVGVSALAVIAIVLTALALSPRPQIYEALPADGVSSIVEDEAPSIDQPGAIQAVQQEVKAALAATEWPAFNPPIENLADQRVPQWTENGCINVSDTNVDQCVYGATQPSKLAVVMGDSIATSWLPAIIGALEPAGYQVRALTLEGCPFAAAEVRPTGGRDELFTECVDNQGWANAKVAEWQPDLIIGAESFLSISRLMSGAEGAAATSEWEAAHAARLSALPPGVPVVVLSPPPGAKNLAECYTPFSSPADCQRGIFEDWKVLTEAEKASSESASAAYIDTLSWFCSEGACPAFAATSATYADTGHLTATRSSALAAVMSEVLQESGKLPE
jgi:peptidoglycan/LPS O-acetylase OafA/YrhL